MYSVGLHGPGVPYNHEMVGKIYLSFLYAHMLYLITRNLERVAHSS
jgi:hypothetical protein